MKLFIAVLLLTSTAFAVQDRVSDEEIIARIEHKQAQERIDSMAAVSHKEELNQRALEATAFKALIQARTRAKDLRLTSITDNSADMKRKGLDTDRTYTISNADRSVVCKGHASAEYAESLGGGNDYRRHAKMNLACYNGLTNTLLFKETPERHEINGPDVGVFYTTNSAGVIEEFRPKFSGGKITSYDRVERPNLVQSASALMQKVRSSIR